MAYCFMNYRPASEGEGFEPDCPEDVGFLLLADLPGAEWGIFEVAGNDRWSPDEPVGDELAGLIESGKRYPPALAIARAEVVQVFAEGRPNRADFARAYALALRTHMARQHDAPYVLAQATRSDAGHLTQGEWYWVLSVSGRPPVASWVSDDFQVHENGMDDFDLSGQQLKRLGFAG